MFETRKDLIAQLDATKVETARLETELATANGKVEEASSLSQQLAEANDDIDGAKTALATEEAAHATTKSDLEAEQVKTTPGAIAESVTASFSEDGAKDEALAPIRDAVNLQVASQVASSGQAPLDFVEQETTTDTPKSLLEEYAKLEGPAKWTFLGANAAALNAEIRKTNQS